MTQTINYQDKINELKPNLKWVNDAYKMASDGEYTLSAFYGNDGVKYELRNEQDEVVEVLNEQ